MIKNKKILFVTDSCPPYLTMSGVVTKNIIDYLRKENAIDIIAIRQGDEDVAVYEGIKVRYITSFPYYILTNRRKKNQSSSRLLSMRYAIALLFFRVLSISLRAVSPLGINLDIEHKIEKAIGTQLAAREYDYVFCNAKPFESFEAAMEYIKEYPNVKFIAYQTDDFVTAEDEMYFPKALLNRRRKRRKIRINEYIDAFFCYGMLESVFGKECAYLSAKKAKSMGIPLLIEHKDSGKKEINRNATLRFVFTGSLVQSYRPPNECLDIMSALSKHIDFLFDIYHRGDCDAILSAYQNNSGGTIRNHGTVSTDAAYAAMDEADVLISISNIAGDQISGKTFDYISTGKPVIHFYYNENDLNKKVLSRYNLALCVDAEEPDQDSTAASILNFIKNNRWKRNSIQDVLNCYSDYTVDAVTKTLFCD